MPRVSRARELRASPETVWDLVSDPHHLPRWWPTVQRVEEASAAAWTKVLRTPRGKTVRADYTRVSAAPPERLVWQQEVDESPFERILAGATTEIDIEAATGGGARVRITTDLKLRGLSRFGGFMVSRATKRQLSEALDGLQRATDGAP